MASNKNIPQKGQGANEPDKKQPVHSDAADVDWMIISDISTRISGSLEVKAGSNQSSATSSSQTSSSQAAENDLEDIEWLRSLGLDEEIERSPSKNTASTSNSQGDVNTDNNKVDNIDWLIVTSLNTRIDDPSTKGHTSPSYPDPNKSQTTIQPAPANISDSLDTGLDLDGLDLDGLDFLENSDFSELDSLGFDTLESFSINGIDGLQDDSNIDSTEGKIQGLAELLDDKDDSSFNLSANENNGDWDSLSDFLEDDSVDFTNDQPSLDIVSESFEMEIPISEIPKIVEDHYEDNHLIPDELVEPTYQDDLLVDGLELPDAIGTDERAEDFELPDDFASELTSSLQSDLQYVQKMASDVPLSFVEEAKINKSAEFNNELDDDFAVMQPLESFDASVDEDEIWTSNSSNLEPQILNESIDDAFTSGWGQIADNANNNANNDDAVWNSSPSLETDIVSSTSIDNAFGTFDEWESDLNVEQIEGVEGNYDDFDLSNNSNNLDSSLENVESVFNSDGFDLESEHLTNELEAETGSEISNDENWNIELTHDEISADIPWDAAQGNEVVLETDISDETDWSEGLEAEISHGNNVVWDEEFVDKEEYLPASEASSEIFHDDLLGIVDSELIEDSINQNADFSENLDDLDDNDWAIADNPDDLAFSLDYLEEIPSDSLPIHENFVDVPDNLDNLEQITDSDLASYADSFATAQVTDSDYADDFSSHVDGFDDINVAPSISSINADLDSSDWNVSTAEALVSDMSIDSENLGDMLNENFDLASFDEEDLLGIPTSDLDVGSIVTTLTPNRTASVISSDISEEDLLIPSVASSNNPFEDPLDHDLLNGNASYEEINFQEEALAHDLLNGLEPEADDFITTPDRFTIPNPNFPNVNLPSPSNFADPKASSDRDFLDDFDLDSIDPTGGEFDSGFVSKPISTGLTPPVPPIAPMPPNLPPLNKQDRQEPTSPSVNTLLPPPFLPPLPPKRTPTQGSASPIPPNNTVSSGTQPQPQNRIDKKNRDNDFDRFHAQPNQSRNRKSITSIDEGWSELLDADTVLSGGRSSDTSSTMPPSAGTSTGKYSQGRERIDHNTSSISKRRETGLPNFNDLGAEIHEDNADWSGLLDSDDLSDSITTISPQTTQLPSRIRTDPTSASRFDGTSASETREIPRDRRSPVSNFGDSSQARMGTPPNQVDFNRFTEDNYDAYDGYEQPVTPQSTRNPNKTRLTMPSVSLESLWQNYLKIPAIGLGVIGGAFLLYSLLNRPVFDLGLRWGLFKDASGKDFTNADFKGAKLDNVDFSKATLTGAKMQDASLVGANFQGANLDGVNFTKANLNRARLIQASVIWAEFNGAQMNLVDLAGADLTRSNFVGAKMEGANLKTSKIGTQGTEKATKFSTTTLLAWRIVNEPRQGRNLANQDLSGLNLSFTSLKRANLTNAKLNYTDMTNTDLSGANISGGQVNGANWSGAKLNGINLTDVIFDKTKLPKTDEETICPNGKKGPCTFQ